MKGFLDEFEIGEGKVKLSKEEKKTLMSEIGKYIKTETEKVEKQYKDEINEYKSTIDDLKEQIKNAPKSDELESLKGKIADYEQKEADRVAKQKAKEEDDILTKNIVEVIGDKKFVNDYTKNSIINEVKTALKDNANLGKSAKDLFEQITNGKDGIFANPNQVIDMPSIDENTQTTISKEDFNKMGYKERLELKSSNPELFKKYNS
jgi:hypothetical protein|nr:MAG TPA: minor structural protein [Caudoviricetes sp.]